MKPYELHHGDANGWMATLADESVDAVLTDPPYGIAYESAWKAKGERFGAMANDLAPTTQWLSEAYRLARYGAPLVCFYRWDVQAIWQQAVTDAGWTIRSQLVWDKIGHGLGNLNASFAPRHELAFFATKGLYEFPGARPVSVIAVPRIVGEAQIHPTEKPVPLMGALVRSLTRQHDIILDPFAGGGATGVAALKEGRQFVGAEIDANYHAIAMKRLDAAYAQPRLLEATT